MRKLVCRKSVFGILFLVLFFLGTICGVILFRCISKDQAQWLLAYGESLSAQEWNLRVLVFSLWPLAAAAAVGALPGKRQLLALLVVLRGGLLAYSASVFCAVGRFGSDFSMELLLLPAFYTLCRHFFL